MEKTKEVTGTILSSLNVYASIERECAELGISVSELCRRAGGVDRSVLERWRSDGDPKSIRTLKKLASAIDKVKAERAAM